ncbi:MAG: nicotinate phosphoribosyltransferase [Gammaproteobacteria bacterium]|nr:nicotinate phosphoribosyltransferase [Gammaproteobacteria bacterium]
MFNPLLMVDGYKLGHHNQYPEGMTYLFSNFTARSNKNFKKIAAAEFLDDFVVVFGTQATVSYLNEVWEKEFFSKKKEAVVDEFANIVRMFLNDNSFTVEHAEALHDLGYLPIKFHSLKEGTLCKVNVPFFTLENTHPDFAWLVNYIETQLSAMLWKPITSATIARHYKKILNRYYEKTCDNKMGMEFMVHDFSMRGLSNVFDAHFSGMGHLTSFSGSDNIPALVGVRKYYGWDIEKEFLAGGVPATEHSVTSSNIQSFVVTEGCDELEAEKKTIEYLISKYPSGFLSYVSDTYDYYGVISEVLPSLKDKLMAREGKFVVRPDSGNPIDIICGLDIPTVGDSTAAAWNLYDQVSCDTPHGERGEDIVSGVFLINGEYRNIKIVIDWNRYDKQYYYTDGYEIISDEVVSLTPEMKGSLRCLWDAFGGTLNEKGYMVLDSHIGIIYGDSITPQRMHEILERMKQMGFAASNVVFGAGSFTYQYTTRDTFGMAMKATYCEVNDVPVKLFKDPKTGDGSKKSAKGMLVVQDGVLVDDMVYGEYLGQKNNLEEINSTPKDTFDVIRQRINEGLNAS